MKKIAMILILSLSVLLFGCGQSAEVGETQIISWAVVRNVKWGMTKDEVIKAEKLDKNIAEEREDSLSWIQSTADLAWREAVIWYVFLDDKLERVYYIVDKNIWFWEYWYLRRALGEKYGVGDIPEEECSKISSQLKEVQDKNIDNKEKLKELKVLQDKIKKCSRDEDIQYFDDSVRGTDIHAMRSTYLSLRDISYYHGWENNGTNIDLILSSGLFGIDKVVLSLEYTSDKLAKYGKEKRQKDLNNSI